VLDVGCASGYLGQELVKRGCSVWGLESDLDAIQGIPDGAYVAIAHVDLDEVDRLPWNEDRFDVVIAADVLEHLSDPSRALRVLTSGLEPRGLVIVSVPNVAHASVRAKLLLGRFDYTPTGILDETHKRFFTFKTARALVEGCGLVVERVLAGSDRFGAILNRVGPFQAMRGLLAFNIVVIARPAGDEGQP
jgi:2-polyprenyl-3-methyl-5-hydroxy-6-metoxy-1,4-benzoquinol methylase